MRSKGLVFMLKLARACRESQGPWWFASTDTTAIDIACQVQSQLELRDSYVRLKEM